MFKFIKDWQNVSDIWMAVCYGVLSAMFWVAVGISIGRAL